MQSVGKGMSLRWLLAASFINSFAFGFIWPLTSVYLYNELYQTLVTIGWVMMANAVGQAIGSIISGRLFDQFKPYRLIQFGVITMIILQIAFILWHGWPTYAIILTLVGFFGGWLTASINAYGTQVRSHDGRFVFNMLYFMSNFGMVFSTALVGPIYPFGITWLFVLALILYVVLFFIVHSKFRINLGSYKREQQTSKVTLPKWNLLLVYSSILGLVVLWISYAQWQGNLSVYMNSVLKLPLWQYSMLWTINGALIAVIQLGMNALNLSANRRSMFVQIFVGIIMFGLSFLVLPFSRHFTGFALVMVITTIGEATAFPMIPALVNELTPLSLKGRYQGLSAAAPSVGRAVGPLAGGFIIQQQGYSTLFYAAAALTFVAFVGVLLSIVLGYRHTVRYEES
ncbi:MDR family MFS transporter [Weissella thailandensis]|uniref:MFS transporter n=1 Tax=Weissella thailandensis TaxID=89061 RepID=A0ABX9I6J3_9LACO|nr:MFS transporter [Weissella thailandensis]NKY90766.1 MFS transporter [Weissella thailandensis]RDS59835.1 MFS transporter [Weissella thailandensis]GEP74294.1 MFS transporter [Weissella thailandensis]